MTETLSMQVSDEENKRLPIKTKMKSKDVGASKTRNPNQTSEKATCSNRKANSCIDFMELICSGIANAVSVLGIALLLPLKLELKPKTFAGTVGQYAIKRKQKKDVMK